MYDGSQHQRRHLRATGDQPGQPVQPRGDDGIGHRAAQLGFRHQLPGGEDMQLRESLPGAFGQSSLRPGSAPATRSAPWRSGSVTVPARTASRSCTAPSRAALATAERRLTSAATWPPCRRSARCPSAWSNRSRACSTAVAMSASASSGASGSVVTPVTLATRPGRSGRTRPQRDPDHPPRAPHQTRRPALAPSPDPHPSRTSRFDQHEFGEFGASHRPRHRGFNEPVLIKADLPTPRRPSPHTDPAHRARRPGRAVGRVVTAARRDVPGSGRPSRVPRLPSCQRRSPRGPTQVTPRTRSPRGRGVTA